MGTLMTVSICRQDVWGSCSDSVPGFALAVVAAPSLLSIAGCQGSGSQTLMGLPATNVLTFSGTSLQLLNDSRGGLVVWNQWIEARGAGLSLSQLHVLSSTEMTLQLTEVYDWLLLPLLQLKPGAVHRPRRRLLEDQLAVHLLRAATATRHHRAQPLQLSAVHRP
jgi:hypothetical protein